MRQGVGKFEQLFGNLAEGAGFYRDLTARAQQLLQTATDFTKVGALV